MSSKPKPRLENYTSKNSKNLHISDVSQLLLGIKCLVSKWSTKMQKPWNQWTHKLKVKRLEKYAITCNKTKLTSNRNTFESTRTIFRLPFFNLIFIGNLPISSGSYKNNALKIWHSYSKELSSYFPVKFVNFLKNRVVFNIFCCVWMFANKLFTYLKCTYLKK